MNPAPGPSALAWLVGALVLAPAELLALGVSGPLFAFTIAMLFCALGLTIGLVIAAVDLAARRLHLSPPWTAGARALPALLPLGLAAAHLFDGGFASTLPGAAYGHLWVPAAGTVVFAAVVWLAESFLSRGWRRLALAGALVVTTGALEYANRRLWPGLYHDVHAFLVLASATTAGAAVHLVWPGLGLRRLRPALAALALTVYAGFAVVLVYGLDSEDERLTVATRGMHARQLARLVRAAVDLDRDGFSPVLGGGDCDDRRASVNPGARDLPGNQRDENCDGRDASPPPPPAADELAGPDQYRAAAAAWRRTPEVAELLAAHRDDDVIVVLVDSLRGDALAGEHRAEYPNLHRLAGEAWHFRRAFSPSAGTDVAVAALLTGRFDPFTEIASTLIEAMAESGRKTHAVLPREVLRWAGKTLIGRGLDGRDIVVTDREKRDVGSHSTGGETTRHALDFIATDHGQPAFLWLHYFDVHEHHQIEDSDPALRAVIERGRAARAYRRKEARYRAMGEIVDDELGRIIAALRDRGAWDRTILVVLSDHGESLGEHPRLGETHGMYLYNPLIHVPLLIRVPGAAPAVIDHPVSLVDLTTTLLSLAGAQPLPGADGLDLLPHVLPGAPRPVRRYTRPIVLNESEQQGLIAWPHKLLLRPADNLLEVYDLARDFGETDNLAHRQPQLVARLRAELDRIPRVVVDRTRKGRKAREELARPPAREPRP